MVSRVVPGSGVLWAKNRPGHAREVGDHFTVVRLIFRGHLGGQASETARTGHFRAKSVCYSPQFQGWARESGVVWAEN